MGPDVNRELRLFLLAIALPAALVAAGGARLLALEAAKNRADDAEAMRLKTAAIAACVERAVSENARLLLAPLAGEPDPRSRIAAAERIAAADGGVEEIRIDRRPAPGPKAPPGPGGRRPDDRPPGRARERKTLEFRTRLSTGEPCSVSYSPAAADAFFRAAMESYDGPRPRSAALVFPRGEPARGRFPRRGEEGTARAEVVRTNARVDAEWEPKGAGPAIFLAGGCLLVLLVASLVSGGWWLVRSARRERLDALRKTDFVDNVSHELKTPLAGIRLCAELLAEGRLPDGPRREKAVRSILSESDRLERLVSNLLDFGRLERNRRKYDLRDVDLSRLVEEMRDAAVPGAAAPAFTFERPAGGGPVARADADAVRQILANLLENARKYAAAGGPPEVSAGRGAGTAELVVADRGPGVPRGLEEKIFERFFRADDSLRRDAGGSGIGLALSRGLARGMGGDLVCRARAGGGAEFALSLPEGGNR